MKPKNINADWQLFMLSSDCKEVFTMQWIPKAHGLNPKPAAKTRPTTSLFLFFLFSALACVMLLRPVNSFLSQSVRACHTGCACVSSPNPRLVNLDPL